MNFVFWEVVKPSLEIIILWIMFYNILVFFEGTRAFQVFKGIIKLMEETRGLISQTQKYIDNGGHYHFNAKSSIEYQKESIREYCKKLLNN